MLENIRKGYFILFLTILFVGCAKIRCGGEDKAKGIVSEVIDFNCGLFPYDDISKLEWVIEDDTTLQNAFEHDSTNWCSFPSIDFSQYTLIGAYNHWGGGNEVKYIREVEKLEDEKIYLFKVKMRVCSLSDGGGDSFNWVLVPKLPQGWTVEFDVENAGLCC